MTFEEIAQLVVTAEPQPDGMTLTEVFCFQSLSILFERFIQGNLDQEQAAAEKQRIQTAFSTRQGFDKMYDSMCATYHANTLVSSSLRIAINKAQDKTANELFIMAVQCISAMTNDTVFLKNISRVQEYPTVAGVI